MRLFLAIEVTGPALEQLVEVRDSLVGTITRQGVRFVRPDKLHLTLSFLGHVEADRVAQLQDALSNVKAESFELQLGQLGAFPNLDRPKVIWLGVGGGLNELAKLASQVAEVTEPFAERQEPQEYHPHITLARVSPGSREVGRMVQALPEVEAPATWRVSQFVLFNSRPDGAYEPLHRVPLC